MTEQITLQLGLSALVILATTALHGLWIALGKWLFSDPGVLLRARGPVTGFLRLEVAAVWIFAAHVGSVWIWAATFLAVDVSGTLEEGLYFAMATYTTLGFGDVLAPEPWRLLTGASAMNGLMLFGLSAAALVESAKHLHDEEKRAERAAAGAARGSRESGGSERGL